MNKLFFHLSIRYSQKFSIIFIGLVLMAGGFIYILFRPTEPLFFDWIKAAGLDNWLFAIRHDSLKWADYLPKWLLYSLPSALWAFSYSLLLTVIWWPSKSGFKYFWLLSIFLLVVGWEILQLIALIPGTCSFGDIVAGIAGAAVGMQIGIFFIKPIHSETNKNFFHSKLSNKHD